MSFDFSKAATSRLILFNRGVKDYCNFYHQYISDILKYITARTKSLGQDFQKKLDALNKDDEASEYYLSDHYSELFQYQHHFSNRVFYGSVYVNIYAFLDSTLRDLCVEMHRVYEDKEYDVPVKGEIYQSKNCLKKYIDFSGTAATK